MPAGKSRLFKGVRDDYVFNRSAPAVAALPRATEELVVAYRIFSPGLNTLTQLKQIAANVSYGIENGMCGELMRNLGISSSCELRDLYKKSHAVYATEIKRMENEEEAEAARQETELVARKAKEQAEEGGDKSTNGCKEGKKHTIEVEKPEVTRTENKPSQKRRRTDDVAVILNSSKRPRHDGASDVIPDPYWLSQADAQAALDKMTAHAKALEATLIRLQDFHLDAFVTPQGAAEDPTVSALLARADTQIRQDAVWYVQELHKIMAGAESTELGVIAAAAGWTWKRDRFDNAAVRGLIERIREFGARLVDTETEIAEADRLRETYIQDCAESGVSPSEGMREMFLEGWARQLRRVTATIAHEAREFVSFCTMEAEWASKWREQRERPEGEEGEEGEEGDAEEGRSSLFVIESSASDEYDSLLDDSDDDLEDDD